MSDPKFDPDAFKARTRAQWNVAAEAWHRWSPMVRDWLVPSTELMFKLAGLTQAAWVLDIAAGDGNQSLAALDIVGASGSVLATDISADLLGFAGEDA